MTANIYWNLLSHDARVLFEIFSSSSFLSVDISSSVDLCVASVMADRELPFRDEHLLSILPFEKWLPIVATVDRHDEPTDCVPSAMPDKYELERRRWLDNDNPFLIIFGLKKKIKWTDVLACLVPREIFSRVTTHKGTILALLYPWYTHTE